MIRAWANAARKGPYRQGVEPQRAIDTLVTLFEGKEVPNNAASSIASLYDPLLKQGFTISPVWELWSIMCEAVRMLGDKLDIDQRLTDLLNAMWRLPDVTDQGGKPIGPGGYVSSRPFLPLLCYFSCC